MMSDVPEQRKRIEIRVPDIYKKVDEGVWEELEQYIFTGFLVSPATIQGQSFVFKTLNHHELKNINFLRPQKISLPEARDSFRVAFITYSLFMVDGHNTLYERPRHINRLMKAIGKLPAKIQENIIENLTALNEKAHNLSGLTEAYTYENRSRYRWLQVIGSPVHSTFCTGVPGTGELGLNVCQLAWTALNRILDRQDEMERDWQNAKFIGSCFAGKSIRSIDEKDKMRREKERVDREELKMKVLYQYLNRRVGKEIGDEEPAPVKLPDGRFAMVTKRFRAETAEELAKQLSAALSGELDYHDLAIQSRENYLRSQAKAIEAQKASLFSRPSALPGGHGSSVRILGSKAEADAYVKRMRELQKDQMERSRRPIKPDKEDSDGPDPEEQG